LILFLSTLDARSSDDELGGEVRYGSDGTRLESLAMTKSIADSMPGNRIINDIFFLTIIVLLVIIPIINQIFCKFSFSLKNWRFFL
jgi:hypothetical protein